MGDAASLSYDEMAHQTMELGGIRSRQYYDSHHDAMLSKPPLYYAPPPYRGEGRSIRGACMSFSMMMQSVFWEDSP